MRPEDNNRNANRGTSNRMYAPPMPLRYCTRQRSGQGQLVALRKSKHTCAMSCFTVTFTPPRLS